MDLLFLILVGVIVFVISLKQIKLPWKYYINLAATGLLVQVGLLLPYFFFPFRPFDYRNAK